MSSCIKDLYDYDLVKKCSKCEILSLKSIFHKDENRQDGLKLHCISRKNQYYKANRETTRNYFLENRDKIKKCQLENRDQVNTGMKEYIKNIIKTDVNYRLFRNTTRRIHHALNGKLKLS